MTSKKGKKAKAPSAMVRELPGTIQAADLMREFRMQFQPVQQEVAALVSELRQKQQAWDNIGGSVARVEASLRDLLLLLADISEAAYGLAPKLASKPPAKNAMVLPFMVKDNAKKPKKKKPGPPDDAA